MSVDYSIFFNKTLHFALTKRARSESMKFTINNINIYYKDDTILIQIRHLLVQYFHHNMIMHGEIKSANSSGCVLTQAV